MAKSLKTQNVFVPFGKLDLKSDTKSVSAGGLVVAENVRYDKKGAIKKRYGYTRLGGDLIDNTEIRAMWSQSGKLWAVVDNVPKYWNGTAWVDSPGNRNRFVANRTLMAEVEPPVFFQNNEGANSTLPKKTLVIGDVYAQSFGVESADSAGTGVDFSVSEGYRTYFYDKDGTLLLDEEGIYSATCNGHFIRAEINENYPAPFIAADYNITYWAVSAADVTAGATRTGGTAILYGFGNYPSNTEVFLGIFDSQHEQQAAFLINVDNTDYVIYTIDCVDGVVSIDSLTSVISGSWHGPATDASLFSPGLYLTNGDLLGGAVFSAGTEDNIWRLGTSAAANPEQLTDAIGLTQEQAGLYRGGNIFAALDDISCVYQRSTFQQDPTAESLKTTGDTTTKYSLSFRVPVSYRLVPGDDDIQEAVLLDEDLLYIDQKWQDSSGTIQGTENLAAYIRKRPNAASGGGLADTLGYSRVIDFGSDPQSIGRTFRTASPGVYVTFYQLAGETGAVRTHTDVYSPPQTVFNGNVYLGGGLLWCADARGLFQAFPDAPQISTEAARAAGTDTASGLFQAEVVSSDNLLFRGGYSRYDLSDMDAATDRAVDIDLFHPQGSTRDTRVTAYGSEVNGTELHEQELSSLSKYWWEIGGYVDNLFLEAQAENSVAVFHPTAAPTTAIWYGENELIHDPVPAPYDLAVSNGRLWAVPHTRDRLWPSKLKEVGFGAEFSSALAIDFAQDGDLITAIEDLDGQLIVYTENNIYSVLGDGPDNTGLGGQFVIRKLVSNFGCINRKSLVQTPSGHIFLSNAGFRRLNRGRQISRNEDGTYWGEEIDTLTDNVEITCSAYSDKFNEVMFGTDNLNFRHLVYNVEFDAWSWDTGIGWNNYTPRNIAVHEGDFYIHAQSGTTAVVHKYDTTKFTDWDGSYKVNTRLRTGYISTAGVGGYQRLRRVVVEKDLKTSGDWDFFLYGEKAGDSVSAYATLTNPLGLPSNIQQTKTYNISDGTAATNRINAVDRVTVTSGLQKNSRFAIEVRESDDSGPPSGSSGEGPRWHGLNLEVGIIPGHTKTLPVDRKR